MPLSRKERSNILEGEFIEVENSFLPVILLTVTSASTDFCFIRQTSADQHPKKKARRRFTQVKRIFVLSVKPAQTSVQKKSKTQINAG